MDKWTGDLQKFQNPEVMRQENFQIMKELGIKREKLSRFRSFGRDTVQDLMTRNTTKERIIKENTCFQELNQMETQMGNLSVSVYRSSDFIKSKSMSSDFGKQKEQCDTQMVQLNKHIENAVQ